jgi:hypothetical protein
MKIDNDRDKEYASSSRRRPTPCTPLAALPDEITATLTPDALLTDPRTGKE